MRAIIVICLFLCSFTANSTIWYVRTDGNNSNAGTSNTAGGAFRTLVKAASVATSGDDIVIGLAGTYTETAQVQIGVGVDLYSVDSAGCIISSTLTAAFTPAIYLSSAEGTNGNQSIHDVSFDGNLTCMMGIIVSGRSNVTIYNCRFYDFFDVGVIFRGRTDFNDGPPTTYSSGNSFHDNYMWNNATIDDSYGRGNLEVGGQIDMLIYNNTIIQTARASGFNGYCIKNVNQGFLKGMKIHDNYLEVPPYPYTFNGTNNRWDFATEFSDLWGMEYYNNTVLGSADQNFQRLASPYTYSVYYHDNTFGRDSTPTNPMSGIILEYKTETGIFERNTFKNITYPFVFTPRSGDTISNLTIKNCLGYGIGCNYDGSGQALRMLGFYNDYQFNWNVSNNTFIAYSSAPTWGIDVPAGNLARNLTFNNNIVRGFSLGDFHVYNGNNIDTLSIQNNDYVNFYITGSPSHYTNSGNLTVAPNLNSTTYAPNPGSPMINAGTDGTDIGYTGGGGDLPPTVSSTSPTNGATNISTSVHPTGTFSEALDGSTVNTTNVTMTTGGSPVTISVSYSSSVITVTPSSTLSNSTTYTVTFGTGITDALGTPMAASYNFSFTTAAASPPPSGSFTIPQKKRRIIFR